jgi:hypothetical protein
LTATDENVFFLDEKTTAFRRRDSTFHLVAQGIVTSQINTFVEIAAGCHRSKGGGAVYMKRRERRQR